MLMNSSEPREATYQQVSLLCFIMEPICSAGLLKLLMTLQALRGFGDQFMCKPGAGLSALCPLSLPDTAPFQGCSCMHTWGMSRKAGTR